MKKTALLSVFSIFLGVLFAEETINANAEQTATQPTATPQINTRPQFRGTLRVRSEYELESKYQRFAINNARACLFGNVNEWMSYQMQVDLNGNGRFRVLDAEVRFRQTKDFSFRIGQMLTPFAQLQQIVPRMVALTELPFVARHMYGENLRDIGVTANYRFRVQDVPVNVTGMLFNGAGIGNDLTVPMTKTLGNTFKLTVGTMNGFRGALKTYHAENLSNLRRQLYGLELRYFINGLTIDTEIVRGTFIQNRGLDGIDETSTTNIGSLVHVGKMFKTERETLKYIEPIVRWDMMGKVNRMDDEKNASRLTFGLNFGFRPYNQAQTFRTGELRLNYEKFFGNPVHLGPTSAQMRDKVILEFTFEI